MSGGVRALVLNGYRGEVSAARASVALGVEGESRIRSTVLAFMTYVSTLEANVFREGLF